MARRRSSNSKILRPGPRPLDKQDARIKRWNTLADIPMDEEDRFHASRDRILLEGEEAGADDEGDEDEVFALKGIPSSESDEDEDVRDEEDYGENQPRPTVRASKESKAKTKPLHETIDEEEEESEEEESWGRKKSAYYSSNAAEIDSEDEEANELEEEEAKRIQAKARDALLDDDFGLADIIEEGTTQETEDLLLEPVMAIAIQLTSLDKKAALRHLEKTNPEALALAYDWEDIATKVVHTQEKIKELSSTEPDSQVLGMAHLHNQALLTYATTLAFYLYLRASENFSQRPEVLRSHPIFARLLQLKQALITLEELDLHLSESDSEIIDTEEEDTSPDEERVMEEVSTLFKQHRKGSRFAALHDLGELLREAEEAAASAKTTRMAKPAARSQPNKERPKKMRKTSTAKKPVPVFDLEEPTFVPSNRRSVSTARIAGEDDAFGDAVVLGTADAADKKARKRTLRFHTSKIESATARRQGARFALGGDDDVPYRDRRKEKGARVQREALSGKRGQGGDDLDDIEPQSSGLARGGAGSAEDNESAEESADGYYSLVQRQKREQKESKKLAYEAAKAASRDEGNEDDAEGPRSLTRAILKNRGLTPRRSKSVRNPRVKKRQKFAKANKVIASQKPVFTSGISKVVKSVRF
ncbi:hypothetical protein F5148DRAFT_1276468 [Russula earlei]|uniref:Uncharacterized protein n=1 Tax=Russula earlei TaxID=71964 RepID=A0ACC0U5V9_9AGAM|nr:hypothetical protein F5148DRAFT_1276468 [Russula earlei]